MNGEYTVETGTTQPPGPYSIAVGSFASTFLFEVDDEWPGPIHPPGQIVVEVKTVKQRSNERRKRQQSSTRWRRGATSMRNGMTHIALSAWHAVEPSSKPLDFVKLAGFL